ncbi:MAG: hypothetical protein ACKV22_04760 [Bryobacteraceae bacterium]
MFSLLHHAVDPGAAGFDRGTQRRRRGGRRLREAPRQLAEQAPGDLPKLLRLERSVRAAEQLAQLIRYPGIAIRDTRVIEPK